MLSSLVLSSCAGWVLPPEVPEGAVPGPGEAAALEAVPRPPDLAPSVGMAELPPSPVVLPMAFAPAPGGALVAPPLRREPPPRRLSTPQQLLQDGHQGARCGPGMLGHRQVGAMHFYQYALGTVFDIYVSPTIATGLLFPPGEVIKVGLFLPKNTEDGTGGFTVAEQHAGDQATGFEAITIHPGVSQGEYDAFVLMHSGRVYLLRIIVGKRGMLTVSFEGPNEERQP